MEQLLMACTASTAIVLPTRDLIQTGKFTLGVGLTAKIRDAGVQLENEMNVVERNDNVGLVPLLHLYTAYRLGGATLYFEGDGLASKQ